MFPFSKRDSPQTETSQARVLARRSRSAWSSYWYSRPAYFSQGICRIAIAIAVLVVLTSKDSSDWAATIAGKDPGVYHAEGILAFISPEVPSVTMLQASQTVAYIATFCFLFGLAMPVSTIASFVSMMVLVCFLESFRLKGDGWCHGLNFIMLAQLGYLFSPGRDVLSADYWFARARRAFTGRGPVVMPRSDVWPILLVQWGLALGFLNAAWWKLTSGTLGAWAFSDHLRHTLLVQYPGQGRDMPAMCQLIANNEILYKGAALGSLLAQSLPILACLCVRRPLLRAFFGAFFVLETLALGFVMNLWHLDDWLPLCAVFIDWDALIRWFSRAPKPPAELPDLAGRAPRWRHGRTCANGFVIAYLTIFISVAFLMNKNSDFNWNTYPFSQFPMYAKIRADKPYGEHRPWRMLGTTFEITGPDTETASAVERKLQREFRGLHARDLPEIQRQLGKMRQRLEILFAQRPYTVVAYRTVFEAPPYPKQARLRMIHRSPFAMTDQTGNERIALVHGPKKDERTKRTTCEFESVGANVDRPALGYLPLDTETPVRLAGRWQGRRFICASRRRKVEFVIMNLDWD